MTDDTDGPTALPAGTRVGRVALTVGDLDRVLPVYRDALGFDVDREGHRCRLDAGGRPLVVLVEAPDAPERPPDAAGLFHVAVRVPTRAALADALASLREHGATLTGASDHLVSEALYLRDPEGNGVEVYRDRPRSEWPRTANGGVEMDTLPLDLEDLSTAATGDPTLPAGTDVGHVHLEVTDLAAAESFYVDALGLRVQARYGDGATFLAAGDYHHHVGLNVWNGRSAPATGGRGLRWFELVLPDEDAVEAARRRLAAVTEVTTRGGVVRVADPDGTAVRLTSGDGAT
ncbi:MAG: VOC family protein [Halobacteriaceae archaeon]